MKTIIVNVCLLAAVSSVLAASPPIPSTPAAVDDIVYARPFTLEQGYRYIFSKEHPWVTEGTLLVLKVNKDLIYPREIAMPVLYVGNQPAERLNRGHESGHLIVIVPGRVDLRNTPIWFGAPNFPHEVDAATANAQRELAEQAGIKPLSQERVNAALAEGGKRIRAADQRTLLRDVVSELILKYSPQEKQLASDYRVPVVGEAPTPPATEVEP
ncbi:MAG: hypothetical protein GX547_06560 [Phycisphaerae bacterium]|nr:hypothetical protein [Phycisphaerae bacterium]